MPWLYLVQQGFRSSLAVLALFHLNLAASPVADPCELDLSTAAERPQNVTVTEKAALVIDARKLLVNTDARNVPTRQRLAGIISRLGAFPDASLIQQILEHQTTTMWTFRAEDLGIVAVTPELAAAAHAWLTVLADAGPFTDAQVLAMNTALDRLPIARLANVSAQAIMMDGTFSAFEGEKSVLTDLKIGQPLSLDRLSIKARAQKASARVTPFGTPTDDSQFLLSGFITLLYGHDQVSDQIINSWLELNREDLWRNTGSRFKSFLKKDAHALAGPTMLGDFLRFMTLLPLTTIATADEAEGQLERFARRLHWSDAKLSVARVFLQFQFARLRFDTKEAGARLDQLIRLVSADNARTAQFLTQARDHLFRDQDIVKFLHVVGASGSDFDTYAYLAPFFAMDPVFTGVDFRFVTPQNRHYLTALVSNLMAAVGALNADAAFASARALIDREREIHHSVSGLRR